MQFSSLLFWSRNYSSELPTCLGCDVMTACYDVTWCDDVTSWRFVSCNNISVYTCKTPFHWQSVRLCVCVVVCLCVRLRISVSNVYCRPTSHHVAQSAAAAASDGQISKSRIEYHSLISKSLRTNSQNQISNPFDPWSLVLKPRVGPGHPPPFPLSIYFISCFYF